MYEKFKSEDVYESKRNIFDEEEFLNSLESSVHNVGFEEEEKAAGKGDLLEAMNEYWALSDERKKDLFLTEFDEYGKPVIATALVKYDMHEELGTLLSLLDESEQMALINSVDGSDSNLLHGAMRNNSQEAVKLLLGKGVNPLQQEGDNEKNTLVAGIENDAFEAVGEFLSFFDKAESRDEFLEKQKIKRKALNKCDDDNNTALHLVGGFQASGVEEGVDGEEFESSFKAEMADLILKNVRRGHERIFTKRNKNRQTAEEAARSVENSEIADSIRDKHTEILFGKLDTSIVRMGADKDKQAEEGRKSWDIDNVLRVKERLERHVSGGGDYERLDELIGPDNHEPEKEFYKPGGRGQRLRWEIDGIFDSEKLQSSNYEVQRGVNELKEILTQGGAKRMQESAIQAGKKRNSDEDLNNHAKKKGRVEIREPFEDEGYVSIFRSSSNDSIDGMLGNILAEGFERQEGRRPAALDVLEEGAKNVSGRIK